MAAQPVGSETVLELLNPVLTLPAIVVEVEERTAAALQVGHQEAQVGAGGGVFGLIADAALTKPALGTVTETGKRALGLLGIVSVLVASHDLVERWRRSARVECRTRSSARGSLSRWARSRVSLAGAFAEAWPRSCRSI